MTLSFNSISTPVSAFQRVGEVIFDYIKSDDCKCIYQHQAEAVKAIKEELENQPEGYGNFRNVSLAVLPTGSGKTGVGILTAYAYRAHRLLIVTPSETISKQQITQFKPVRDTSINPLNVDPFLLQRKIVKKEEEEKWAPLSGVCVLKKAALKDALNNKSELVITNAHKFGDGRGKGLNIAEFPKDYFSLVIVDEAHHYPADTWRNIVDHFQPSTKILFLTATPYHKGKYILEGKEPCYILKRKEAVTEGIIRETNFIECSHVPLVNPTPKEKRNEEIRQVLEKVHKSLQAHDSQDSSARHKAMILARSTEEAQQIVDVWMDYYSTIGECKTFVQNNSVENVQEFEKPESKTRVLVVIFRLTEGFDCKNVSVAAILRTVAQSSRVYFAQFVGRAVRKLHPNDPVKATVISHQAHDQRPNFDTFEELAEEDPIEDD